jgi:acyl-CoA synthetase (AMP-forming)/AMP-acid ligase II/thioesterase domain-containing protein/acyl carrier protein
LEAQITETFGDIVRRHARNAPDAPALVAEGQDPLSYGELVRLMDRVRHRLNAMGYGRGDRIAIVAPNGPAMAALITGIWGCATAVPMNPALTVGEFAIHLRDLKVQAVAVDADMDTSDMNTAARAAAREIGLPVLEVERIDKGVAGMIDFRPGVTGGQAARPGAALSDDLAMILTTSGTTSHSKIVPANQRQLSAKIDGYVKAFELTAADRCLNLMPLFHGHGLVVSLGATLNSGGSFVTLPEFSVDAFFHLLETLAPTWYTGSYTFHHTIAAAAPSYTVAIEKSRLRLVRTASGHLDSRIADELEVIFRAPVIETYSNTEVALICCTPFPPAVRKRGTVGRACGSEVAIIGPDKRVLATDERGEVVVRGGDTFTGYENDPAANLEAFFDGWFRTGDEGVFDEDGYLTLTGRIKDIINRGGEKITPSEVDDALMGHPDVTDAVTFPVPHATLGQEVAAAVVPAIGADFTDEILARYLRGKLAPFKVPRRFIIVDEIPKGPTGKIPRRSLAEAFDLVTATSLARPEPADDRPATPLEADLQRLWAEALGLDHVGLHDDFFMLGGDSLQAVELFLRIEQVLGRRLPRSVLFEAGTVAGMAQRIEELTPSPCLVPIQPKGDRPPFFCVHDGNGHVLNYRDLARFVGEAQPFYGIQCRGLDGEEEPFTRIEDMAAYYVGEIRKLQPVGPYYIGGYSFGGRVAYVMAQQLRAAGEEVALLALFDSASGYGQRRVTTADWLAHHRERLRALPFTRVPAYLWLRGRNLAEMIYMRLRLRSFSMAWRYFESRGRPIPRILHRPVPANDMIRSGYRPRPYGGDATLFKAERYAWTHADAHDGWFELIKGKLEIRPISGRHYEIVKQPHVQTLAAELSDALDQARAASSKPVRRAAKV